MLKINPSDYTFRLASVSSVLHSPGQQIPAASRGRTRRMCVLAPRPVGWPEGSTDLGWAPKLWVVCLVYATGHPSSLVQRLPKVCASCGGGQERDKRASPSKQAYLKPLLRAYLHLSWAKSRRVSKPSVSGLGITLLSWRPREGANAC